MSVDEPELEARLERLEEEERNVSSLRRKLHDRLSSFPNDVLAQQERELSVRRRELHQEIDELRIQIRMTRRQA